MVGGGLEILTPLFAYPFFPPVIWASTRNELTISRKLWLIEDGPFARLIMDQNGTLEIGKTASIIYS